MSRSWFVALGLLVLVAARLPAEDKPQVPRELLEQRRDAARKVFTEDFKRFFNFRAEINPMFAWSQRWLEAELVLSDKKADRIASLEAHLERLRRLEKVAIQHARVGQLHQRDADAATYYRVDAEIRLFQVTGKMPPPAKEPSPKP